jgi:hypothetical protein
MYFNLRLLKSLPRKLIAKFTMSTKVHNDYISLKLSLQKDLDKYVRSDFFNIQQLQVEFPPKTITDYLDLELNIAFLTLQISPVKDENIAQMLKYFVENGIDVNNTFFSHSREKTNLLSYATLCGLELTVKQLLNLGATCYFVQHPKWFKGSEDRSYDETEANRALRCLVHISAARQVEQRNPNGYEQF